MLVKEIMTRKLHTVRASQYIEEAARIMGTQNIGCLLVTDREELSGLLTDRDIVVRVAAKGNSVAHTLVYEAMSKNIRYCMEDMNIGQAVLIMENHHVRRLPVKDSRNRLVGMLSVGDIARNTDYLLTGAMMRKVTEQVVKESGGEHLLELH